MSVISRLRAAALLLLCTLLAACSSLSPYSSTTKLALELQGSDRLNPDLNGRPSPIVLRLYELKRPVAFENSDFFALYQRSKDVLAQDLVAEEELSLRPGEEQQLQLSVKPDSRYVGVLAAYRDLPESRWHYVIALEPEEINRVTLHVGDLGLHNPADDAAQDD